MTDKITNSRTHKHTRNYLLQQKW